ncbi:hypothetical protein ACQY0O_006959 [Thecaphora frezii]
MLFPAILSLLLLASAIQATPPPRPDLPPRNAAHLLLSRQTQAQAQSSTGSSSGGGDATVSANTTTGSCSLTNHLSVNQQASWSTTLTNTCCVYASYSLCYLRLASSVSGSEACLIPNCDELASNDAGRMAGFQALNSTNGEGHLGNRYPSFGMADGAPALGFSAGLLVAALAVAVGGTALV